MLRRLLLMLVLCFPAPLILGQEAYRAVFAGGRVYLAEETRFSQVNNGQQISSEARLELVGNALLVLMDKDGRLSSLSLSGKYDLSDLAMEEVSDSSSFVKSVWEEYYRPMDEEPRVEELLLQGGVEDKGSRTFELSIPSSSQVFGNRLKLACPPHEAVNYKVDLINEFGEVFRSINVAHQKLILDLFDKDLVWKPEVTMRISSAEGIALSPFYTLGKLSPPDYETIDRLFKKHFKDSTFTTQLTKAAFFENRWLFADAQTILMDLIESHGSITDNFWNQYLMRNGFYAISRR